MKKPVLTEHLKADLTRLRDSSDTHISSRIESAFKSSDAYIYDNRQDISEPLITKQKRVRKDEQIHGCIPRKSLKPRNYDKESCQAHALVSHLRKNSRYR